MISFPAPATAAARMVYQIGGSDALHTFLLNYIIIPNCVKLLPRL